MKDRLDLAIMACFLSLIIGLLGGVMLKKGDMQRDLARMGYAEYIVNPKTGQTTFRYKSIYELWDQEENRQLNLIK